MEIKMNKSYANKRTRRCLKYKQKNKIKNRVYFMLFLSTFSPFDAIEVGLGVLDIVTFAAGKRSRFSRIGFVSVVCVTGFADANKRLVIDGAEHGNEIAITVFSKRWSIFY